MKLETIAKQLLALQKAVSNLNKITIVQTSKRECLKLLDIIEKKKIYTVKKENFDPGRIRKIAKDPINKSKYYVGYLGSNEPENCTAIIAADFNRPSEGFIYIDQLVGVKRDYGFKTLRIFINKFKQNKIWLLASPKYDESTDAYSENKKLNAQYRKKVPELKEIHLDNVELGPKCKCGISWFYTPNCKNEIVNMVKSGNYYGT